MASGRAGAVGTHGGERTRNCALSAAMAPSPSYSFRRAEPRLGRRPLPAGSSRVASHPSNVPMRQHCDVTDRNGILWHCELLRLRLTAGAQSDVRPRARILCTGSEEVFELELLAADWIALSDEDLLAEIEQEAACRRASRRCAELRAPSGGSAISGAA